MEILAALPQPKEPSSNIKRRFKGKKPPMLSTVPGKPHQMVLKFATAVPDAALPVEKAKVTRSRNGCFNCRKRKKKCDEKRPSCSTCSHKSIECIWPRGKEKLPKEYKIPDPVPTKASTPTRNKSLEVIQCHFDPQTRTESTAPMPSTTGFVSQLNLTDISDLPLLLASIRSPTPDYYAALDPESCTTLTTNQLPDIEMNEFMSSINLKNLLYPDDKQRFMNACVNGFIKSLGPQYTHPLLTTSATFTPLIESNSVIEAVAEACGCSFLSWSNPDLTELSFQKYQKAVSVLMKFVNSQEITRQDVAWIGAAFQMLCLGAKVTWNCNNKVSVRNLKNSYKLIKSNLDRFKWVSPRERQLGPELPHDAIFQDFTTEDNLMMEIENSLIGYETGGSAMFERQFERMFIESFIYNYSVSVLITDDIEGLPNPFEVFKTLKPYVKTPLFSCDVVWMNNPVLGAAFDAFELVAKSSYLIRHSENEWSLCCARKLLEIASFYPPPMIPPEIRLNETKYANLKDSVLVADIVMKAAKIVLRKVLDPTLSEHEHEIQKDVEHVITRLTQISPNSPVWIISSWAMFIVGLASLRQDHRDLILDALFTAAEIIHGRFIGMIVDVLEIGWGMGSKNGLISAARGLDVLLDPQLLCMVYI